MKPFSYDTPKKIRLSLDDKVLTGEFVIEKILISDLRTQEYDTLPRVKILLELVGPLIEE